MLAKEKYDSRGGELVDVFGVRSRRSFEFITGPGGGLGASNGGPRPFRFNKHGWECMLVVSGLIIQRVASLGRDSQNERDGATPSCRSQQHYNLALKWSSHRRVPPGGAAGSTSRRDAAQQQHLEEGRELLLLRSVSSVAGSQQQQAEAACSNGRRRQCAGMMSGLRGVFS